jgi:predicted MFS family arabinose efflux permease
VALIEILVGVLAGNFLHLQASNELSSFAPPLLFLGTAWVPLVGMIFWGIGMGTQGSLLNALVADLVPASKRSTAFGFFDAAFGIAWFAGSWLMGVLYGASIAAVIIFSVAMQLLSLPIFFFVRKTRRAS